MNECRGPGSVSARPILGDIDMLSVDTAQRSDE